MRPAWSYGSSAWHLPVLRRTKTQKNTRQFLLFPLEDEIFYFFLPSEMALNFNQICWFSNANNFFNFQHDVLKWAVHMFKSMNATSLSHKKRLLWLQNLFKMTFQNGHVCCCCWNYFFFVLCCQCFFLTKMSSHNASVTWILDAIWLMFDLVRLIVVFLCACMLHFYHRQHVCCWN